MMRRDRNNLIKNKNASQTTKHIFAVTIASSFMLTTSVAMAQERILIGVEEFNNIPSTSQTDLFNANTTTGCLFGPGIPDGGAYVVKSTTGGIWNASGNVDPNIAVPAGVVTPSGNYFTINAFTPTPGDCTGVADTNGNGVAGEMICALFNNVYPGRYALSTFVAEVTNTDPFVDSYSFSVVGSVDGTLVPPTPISTLSQGNSNWQYNELLFDTNASLQNLRGCFIQTIDRQVGADIATDNFALYAFNPEITITKTGIVGPIQADGSFSVDYTVMLENTGEASLTQPTLTDNLEVLFGDAFDAVVGVTTPIFVSNVNTGGYNITANPNFNGDSDPNLISIAPGTQVIAPNDRFTITFSANFDALGFNGGLGGTGTNIVNSETLIGPSTLTSNGSFDFPIPAATTDLITVKSLTSGNLTPKEGDTVSYQIIVTNNGVVDASSVSVTDLLPSALTATANNGDVTLGSYDAGSGLWTIPTLPNGDSASLVIEGVINSGQFGNTITNILASPAIGDQPDPSTGGDTLSVAVTVAPFEANFSITKTNTPGVNGDVDQANDIVNWGATTNYTLRVTNNGPDTVTGAVVTDTLVSGLICDAANNVNITGAGIPTSSFTVADLVGAGITLGTLAAGETAILTYECVVN